MIVLTNELTPTLASRISDHRIGGPVRVWCLQWTKIQWPTLVRNRDFFITYLLKRFNPLHRNISIIILHSVLYTSIKSFLS